MYGHTRHVCTLCTLARQSTAPLLPFGNNVAARAPVRGFSPFSNGKASVCVLSQRTRGVRPGAAALLRIASLRVRRWDLGGFGRY